MDTCVPNWPDNLKKAAGPVLMLRPVYVHIYMYIYMYIYIYKRRAISVYLKLALLALDAYEK